MRILLATAFSLAAIAASVAEPKGTGSAQTNMGALKSPQLTTPSKLKPANSQLNPPGKPKAAAPPAGKIKTLNPGAGAPIQAQRKAGIKSDKTQEGSDRASNYELDQSMSDHNQAEALKDSVQKKKRNDCIGCKI